jgi:hypothetical protein
MVLIAVETDHRQFGFDELLRRFPVGYFVMLSYREDYIFRDAKAVEKRAALEEKTVMSADSVQGVFTKIVNSLVLVIDLSGIRSEQNDEMFYQNGLATTARAYNDGRFSLFHSERNIVKDNLSAESLRDVLKHDYAVFVIDSVAVFVAVFFQLALVSLIKPCS